MKPTLKSLALSLCALSLASCSDFSSQSSSWWLRYHPEENEAIYVEVQDSVTAGKSGAEALRKLVGGWRRYPAEGGLISFDFDEEIDWSDAPEGLDLEEAKKVVASLRAQVEVKDAGVYRFGPTGIGFFRVTHIKDLDTFLRDINYFLNVFLYDAWKDESLDATGNDLLLSQETKERWLQRAENKEPWLTRDGKVFSLNIPMTEGEAARILTAMMYEANDLQDFAWLFRGFTGLRVADGDATFSFSPPGQRFEGGKTEGDDTPNPKHEELLGALQEDPGFVEFDRAKLLERVK
jgi:hypothetical protein